MKSRLRLAGGIACAALAVSACGDATVSVPPSFYVVDTFPDQGQVFPADAVTQIAVLFSAEVASGTLADNVKLSRVADDLETPVADVALTFTTFEKRFDQATFEPAPLAAGGAYRLEVLDGVEAAAGGKLSPRPAPVVFRTE